MCDICRKGKEKMVTVKVIMNVIDCVLNDRSYRFSKDNILEIYIDESCNSKIPDIYFKTEFVCYEEEWDEEFYKFMTPVPVQMYYLIRSIYDVNGKIIFFLKQISDDEFNEKQLTETNLNLKTA
jgi:hypothetical protein